MDNRHATDGPEPMRLSNSPQWLAWSSTSAEFVNLQPWDWRDGESRGFVTYVTVMHGTARGRYLGSKSSRTGCTYEPFEPLYLIRLELQRSRLLTNPLAIHLHKDNDKVCEYTDCSLDPKALLRALRIRPSDLEISAQNQLAHFGRVGVGERGRSRDNKSTCGASEVDPRGLVLSH